MRLVTLLLAAGRIAAASVESSCSLQDSCSLPENGSSLLQVRKDNSATRSSLAPRDSRGTGLTKETQPHVCVIARACGPHVACAPGPGDPQKIVQSFLASIVAQNYISWELHLVNSQGGGEIFEDTIARLDDHRLINGPSSPSLYSANSWGYDATNYALESMFAQNSACEYFLFTNADNLYAAGFMETGLPGMLQGADLLGFNFVTRYWQPATQGAHMPMADPKFELGHIDLGAALVSARALKDSGIRFNPAHKEQTDWKLFEEILQRPDGRGSLFYPELHYIHQ